MVLTIKSQKTYFEVTQEKNQDAWNRFSINDEAYNFMSDWTFCSSFCNRMVIINIEYIPKNQFDSVQFICMFQYFQTVSGMRFKAMLKVCFFWLREIIARIIVETCWDYFDFFFTSDILNLLMGHSDLPVNFHAFFSTNFSDLYYYPCINQPHPPPRQKKLEYYTRSIWFITVIII